MVSVYNVKTKKHVGTFVEIPARARLYLGRRGLKGFIARSSALIINEEFSI